MRSFNVFEGATEADPSDPAGYRTEMARFGPSIGASMIGASVYMLPPGQAGSPYHYELGDEEWLIVLDGEVVVRDPDGEHRLGPGDTVCFPAGAQGAHKVAALPERAARVLMLSTRREPSVAIFPDSDKIGVIDPGDGRSYEFPRSAAVNYWQGEAQSTR
jgi:uncharacterized cupin superfamily protein